MFYGSLQHVDGGSQGELYLRYHVYLLLEEVEQKDTIGFAYGNGQYILVTDNDDVWSKDNEIVVEKDVMHIGSEDGDQGQASGSGDDH